MVIDMKQNQRNIKPAYPRKEGRNSHLKFSKDGTAVKEKTPYTNNIVVNTGFINNPNK